MKATLEENYMPEGSHILWRLDKEIVWDVRAGNRAESFQALDLTKTYSYGKSDKVRRTYTASAMHPIVKCTLDNINKDYKTDYNICVLNKYENQRNSLDWHADDSPEQDPSHPICVISQGATRYIYVRENGYKGVIPEEKKFLLTPGSLFIMPPGFQETHQHKIPRHDKECGMRISMTFRKLDR